MLNMSKDKIDFLNKELKKIEDRNKKINDKLIKLLNSLHFFKFEKIDKKIEEKCKKKKGAECSKKGKEYEKKIHDIVKRCSIYGRPFNTQDEADLGGSSSKNDISCNYIDKEDIGIEVKKSATPDWMQSSIKFNNDTKKWEVTKGKNPKKCRKIFNNLINNINLYDGDVPPFFMRKITHKEWKKIKEKTDKWNDVYFDIPPDTISKLYSAKGCKYIQISDNYGLYHLGIDICGFDVLPFITVH